MSIMVGGGAAIVRTQETVILLEVGSFRRFGGGKCLDFANSKKGVRCQVSLSCWRLI
jgi:hypothetical protein